MGFLRRLPVDQQVAVLFAVLFGLLVLVTAAAALWRLRPHSPDDEAAFDAGFRRDLGALWVGVTMFWLAWVLGQTFATVLCGAISFLALREFITLQHTRRGDHRTLLLAFFIVLPLQYGIIAGGHFDLFVVFIPVYVFFALPVVSALAGDPERFLERNAKIQWGVLVCVYGLSHAPALLAFEYPRYEGRGAFLVFFLVTVVAVADVVMEMAAKRWPSKVLAPRISTLFSYRAWGLAVLSGAFVGALLYWITPFKPLQALVMGAAAAAVGTLGELVMDALKRDAGVEQWGNQNAITGAVGLLDRVAPLCFAAPVFYHGVRWYVDSRSWVL
jgi:phosphatidate cytidylyltransferase